MGLLLRILQARRGNSTPGNCSNNSATVGQVDPVMEGCVGLVKLVSRNSDIQLVFKGTKQANVVGKTDSCTSTDSNSSSNNSNTLDINSCVLSAQSPVVLEPLLNLALSEKDRSSRLKPVPIEGTSRDDFLTVLSFVYPMTPPPEVTWDNLEVLLVECHKWDIQVPLARVSDFLKANVARLSMKAGDHTNRFVFKWLHLADRAGLADACAAMVQQITARCPQICTPERLEGLSPKTMVQLVTSIATKCQANCKYCGSRPCNTDGCCSRCG